MDQLSHSIRFFHQYNDRILCSERDIRLPEYTGQHVIGSYPVTCETCKDYWYYTRDMKGHPDWLVIITDKVLEDAYFNCLNRLLVLDKLQHDFS